MAAIRLQNTMISLRPKQQHGIDLLRRSVSSGKRAPILVAPCGFGKTRVSAAIAEAKELMKHSNISA